MLGYTKAHKKTWGAILSWDARFLRSVAHAQCAEWSVTKWEKFCHLDFIASRLDYCNALFLWHFRPPQLREPL